MKPSIHFCAVAILLLSRPDQALAQIGKVSGPPTASQVLGEWVSNVERLVIPAADAMPEESYSFVPKTE